MKCFELIQISHLFGVCRLFTNSRIGFQVEVSGQCVLEPNAVMFCARKVAAVAGDMRKALDVCRRAVETVEAEVRKQQILQTAGMEQLVQI